MTWLDRNLVLKLSLLGPAMGALRVMGAFPQDVDRYAWLAVTLFTAFVVARSGAAQPFGNGAVIGFAQGASAKFVEGLFADTFLANNPWVLEAYAGKPEGTNLQYVILQLVPFVGVATALLTGFFCFVASRLLPAGDAGEGDQP